MARLTKKALIVLVVDALAADGWTVTFLTKPGEHPARFKMEREGDEHTVRLYIWNLSHGGKPRSKKEFRIQITGIHRFNAEPNGRTIILGWGEAFGVFAGFDAQRRFGSFGASPSIQIKSETLQAAAAYDVGAQLQDKGEGEYAIGLRPDKLALYVQHLEDAHAGNLQPILAPEKSRAGDSPADAISGPTSSRVPTDLTEESNAEPAEDIDQILENEERQLSETDESGEVPPTDIVAFNELRSCADLYRLFEANQLDISPEYQRDLVWAPSDQTRFIDSLTKQLPIPSMCISLDYKTERRQVVDGLQRMSSIIRFLSDRRWRLSNLSDIDQRIANKTVDYIFRQHNEIFVRVENTAVPVTVLRCDLSKRSHQEYLFTIFHRLNTGGLKLTNQEIRNCIYTGEFNRLLKRIASSVLFVNLFSIDPKKKYRQSNEEFILRVLSFSEGFKSYRGPLSKHLNSYMSRYRNAEQQVLDSFESSFVSALTLLYVRILKETPLPRLSKATTEAALVGVIHNLNALQKLSNNQLKAKYAQLLGDELFSLEALREGLAARDRVIGRLTRATEIFG